ncbi:hypothetical protein HHK36_012505 [Tetracentron sinense]|uniref:Auxin-responsive protein n=1 Tax=Tetracentron sinense TaxID=13715 RepID=A0A835DFK0_TETSI|nr:hypothetical protein HHK36_012505 [Tetracentron sinense]
MKLQNNASTSVISSHSMQLGVLATASHAISTGTMFTVYYRPRTSPEFIIPYDQYTKSVENNYLVGMRFRMRFEGEECPEQRLAGTIVGIEDVDQIRWPGSKWRHLRVQWDDTSTTIVRPDRVSPWNIEPLAVTNTRRPSLLPRPKRARAHHASSPESSALVTDALPHGSIDPTPPQRYLGVLQGQEIRAVSAHESGNAPKPLLQHLVHPPESDWGQTQTDLQNQLHFSMHDPFNLYSGSTIPFPHGIPQDSGLGSYWLPPYTSCVARNDIESSGNRSVPNVSSGSSGFQEWRAPEPKVVDDTPLTQPNGVRKCMLFGVDLVKSPLEPASPHVVTSSELRHPCFIPETFSQSGISESVQLSEASKSTKPVDCNISGSLSEKPCKNCCYAITRSCTKVHKYGIALGRSVDLMRFEGYDELICELDQMFDFQGKLIGRSNGWHVTYTDDEGDTMLIGDYPWEFRSIVLKMFICPKEEADEQISSSPDHLAP